MNKSTDSQSFQCLWLVLHHWGEDKALCTTANLFPESVLSIVLCSGHLKSTLPYVNLQAHQLFPDWTSEKTEPIKTRCPKPMATRPMPLLHLPALNKEGLLLVCTCLHLCSVPLPQSLCACINPASPFISNPSTSPVLPSAKKYSNSSLKKKTSSLEQRFAL